MSFGKNKKVLTSCFISILTVLILATGIIFANWTATVEAEKIQKENILQKKQTEISMLQRKLENVEMELVEKTNQIKSIKESEAYALSKEIAQYLDIENDEHITKAIQIFENTPLDLQTSSLIVSYSEKLNVDIPLVLGLIDLESEFKQYEVGYSQDRGYCQIIPSTEKWLTKEYGHLLNLEYDPDRIFDPEYNIGLGMIYLSILEKAYGDDTNRILTEYNRGPYNSKAYYERNNTYVSSYSKTVASRASNYSRRLEK